jgi:Leucine-rich repeat (LRR) protein
LNGLVGFIPSEIRHLDNLVIVWLDDNQIGGTLPANIAALSNLSTYIDSVCNHICLRKKVADVCFHSPDRIQAVSNELSGTIPSELGQSSSLQTLFLRNNSFIGSLPSELAKARSLGELSSST